MNNFIIKQAEITDHNRYGYANQIVGTVITPYNRLPYFAISELYVTGTPIVNAFYLEKLDFFGQVVETTSLDVAKITYVSGKGYILTNAAHTMTKSECMYRLRIVINSQTLISQNFITFVPMEDEASFTFDSDISSFDSTVLTFDMN